MKKKIKKSTEKDYNKFRKNLVFSCIDVIIIKNNSVLLTKRTQNPHKGSWHLPGNIIRKNETMRQAVKRAAKNELNLNVKIKKYVGVYENLNSFRHDISHGFIVLPTSRKIKSPILQILRYEAVIFLMPEIIQLGLNFLANRGMNKNTPVISLGCFYSFLNC